MSNHDKKDNNDIEDGYGGDTIKMVVVAMMMVRYCWSADLWGFQAGHTGHSLYCWSIVGDTRLYSTILGNTQQYSVILSNTRQYLVILSNTGV